MYVGMYVCMYLCMYVCIYVCMYVGMYVCILIETICPSWSAVAPAPDLAPTLAFGIAHTATLPFPDQVALEWSGGRGGDLKWVLSR